jgi:hypothetical protein
MVRVPLAAVWAGLALTATAQVPTVGVFLDFDHVPGKVPVEVMKKEVANLLKSSGVSLNWRMAGDNTGSESFDGLVVLKFHGKCRAEAWQDETASGAGALGQTLVENGHVLPFTEVKCDAVRQALGLLRPEANQGEKQKALGLAMGRVVAHELYHVLARTTVHAARGLAKAAESLEELVGSPEIPFRKEDAEAIGEGVRKRVAVE